MAEEHLKLGKSSPFVKTHLRRLPPCDEVWEADFMWAVRSADINDTVWYGLVVSREGRVLAQDIVERPPTVNDMAGLLARAMQRPFDESPRRPGTLRIRKRLEWRELLPHLEQVVERVVSAPAISHWDKAFHEFSRQEEKFDSKPPPLTMDDLFPAVAEWVRTTGWIEIGKHEESGFVVRASNSGGLAFEDGKAKTLGEALSALETGLVDYLETKASKTRRTS